VVRDIGHSHCQVFLKKYPSGAVGELSRPVAPQGSDAVRQPYASVT